MRPAKGLLPEGLEKGPLEKGPLFEARAHGTAQRPKRVTEAPCKERPAQRTSESHVPCTDLTVGALQGASLRPLQGGAVSEISKGRRARNFKGAPCPKFQRGAVSSRNAIRGTVEQHGPFRGAFGSRDFSRNRLLARARGPRAEAGHPLRPFSRRPARGSDRPLCPFEATAPSRGPYSRPYSRAFF
ncbi:hypothetical protein M885DRAFT_135087 [Pelagophyceae sp. CCMP2097]|nr:hypothetical protein M885DRAFT_135087 [Pelagophyceae sp. CCMP2097]